MSPSVRRNRIIGVVGAVALAALLFTGGFVIASNLPANNAYSASNPSLYSATHVLDSFTTPVAGPASSSASQADINLLQAFQNVSRSVADAVLPVVVRVDVEKKVAVSRNSSPFQFFFNGRQFGGQGDDQPQEQYEGGYGSGIVIDQKQDTVYVLTNNHVVTGDNTTIKVKLSDGKTIDATLVGSDKNRDLAVISFVSKDRVPVAKLGDSAASRPGDVVFAIGSPYGIQNTITQGIVSAVGRTSSDLPSGGGDAVGSFTDYIQTDAAINPGNSGGALVNINGEVIGINSWIATRTGENVGLGFAIPINSARKVALDFITKGKVEYGWLGVTPNSVLEENRASLKLSSGQQGAFIYNVIKGSPAEKSGLLPGDLVTSVNDINIKTADDLVRTVASMDVGKEAKLVLIRDGLTKTITIKLGLRDESVDASAYWPGFAVMPATEQIRAQLRSQGTAQGQGKNVPAIPADALIVVNVDQSSGAAEAGLRQGDQVLAVNGQTVKNAGDFYRAFTNGASAKEFQIKILRNGKEVTISWQK